MPSRTESPNTSDVFSMSGKIVIVTGASSGIGAHFTKVLARAGASAIVLAARRMDRLKHLKKKLVADFPICQVMAVHIDVADVRSIKRAFDEAEKQVGLITVCVNCAGVAKPSSVVDLTEADWDSMMRTNLRGAVFVAKEACKRLIAAGSPGTIVNVASILGLRPGSRQVAYGAAKAGLLHATRIMACEMQRYRIRVNAVCPGYFRTEMNAAFFETSGGKEYAARIPPGRLGLLRELDGPLLLLASDASSFMTGTHLTVDLGHSNAAL